MLTKKFTRLAFGVGCALSIMAIAPPAMEAGLGCTEAGTRAIPPLGTILINVVEGDRISIVGLTALEPSWNLRLIRPNGTQVGPIPSNLAELTIDAEFNKVEVFNQIPEGRVLTVTCTPVAGAETGGTGTGGVSSTTQTTVATVGANVQNGAITAGSDNGASDQFRETGGALVTRNSVFMSSQGLPNNQPMFGAADWSAWASLEYRGFGGAGDGNSLDFVAGLGNRVNNDLIIGGLIAYEDMHMTVNGVRVDTTAPAIGVYMARRFGDDLRFNAAYSIGRPEYRFRGVSFDATRHMISMSLRGSQAIDNISFKPFTTLTGFSEDQSSYVGPSGAVAAAKIEAVTISLGSQLTPVNRYANGVLPYLSFAADFNHRESSATGNDALWSPRIGLGMDMAFNRGNLTVDLDAGELLDNVDDYGVKIAYEWNF